MRLTSFFKLHIQIPFGRTRLTLEAGWLILAPAIVWVVGVLYVPILGSFLSPVETWVVAGLIFLLVGVSLAGHVTAHLAMARGNQVPAHLPLYPFGDPAQSWPAAPSARREAAVALAGPVAHGLLAGLAYLVWDAQLHPYLNISMFFLIVFNAVAGAVNLTPAFPFDGGRLLRAVMWGLLKRPALTTRWGMRLGFLLSATLILWGLFLILQRARFSAATGGATILVAALILVGLRLPPAWQWDRPVVGDRMPLPGAWIRLPLAGLLVLGMLAVTVSLVPMNNGLEAPGFVESVEPMVVLPPEHRYPPAGTFILTSVIPQAPITVGEWVYGHLSPAITIVPPERIVPPDTSAQEMARLQYQMLDESQTTALAVGLRLAGFDVAIEGKGARVVSILPESSANEALRPDDVITGVNGDSIRSTAELINQIQAQKPEATVRLQVERAGQLLEVTTSLMPPAEPDGSPRIGITVESAGFDVDLPFPAEIVPQKISGGPSAGLIFTLTVYNLVTPEDLTGGRRIAGTGAINPDGTVGPIGGVQQKVIGAEWTGAEYFLSPPENYADALAAARRIEVVEVATAEQAIEFLRRLPSGRMPR